MVAAYSILCFLERGRYSFDETLCITKDLFYFFYLYLNFLVLYKKFRLCPVNRLSDDNFENKFGKERRFTEYYFVANDQKQACRQLQYFGN